MCSDLQNAWSEVAQNCARGCYGVGHQLPSSTMSRARRVQHDAFFHVACRNVIVHLACTTGANAMASVQHIGCYSHAVACRCTTNLSAMGGKAMPMHGTYLDFHMSGHGPLPCQDVCPHVVGLHQDCSSHIKASQSLGHVTFDACANACHHATHAKATTQAAMMAPCHRPSHVEI